MPLNGSTPATRHKWRQINQIDINGEEVPIQWHALRMDAQEVLLIGRDLRPMAAMQQRLIEAQHGLERDFWRLRNAETRFRLLFQMSTEAVIILESSTQKIVELNPAAEHLLNGLATVGVGVRFPKGLGESQVRAIDALLDRVRASGRPDEIELQLGPSELDVSGGQLAISATLFRQEQHAFILLRISTGQSLQMPQPESARVIEAVTRSVDAFVLTDHTGDILWCNEAFIDLVHVADAKVLQGEPLNTWLGRNNVEFNVLMANLKQKLRLRSFVIGLRGEDGTLYEVETSAVAMLTGVPQCYAFTMRNLRALTGIAGSLSMSGAVGAAGSLPRPLGSGARGKALVPSGRSAEELKALVGRAPLKQIVTETTDIVEKLCIEAALALAGQNRVAAAEMLGVSRQSLYMKMRQLRIGGSDADSPPLDSD
jgi:transcriptional regulator PpsR